MKRPAVEKPQVVPPATSAVLALVAVMPERYRALVVTTAGTGLRQGKRSGSPWATSTSSIVTSTFVGK